MMLTAYAQANHDGELRIWVGIFGAAQPPARPAFTINGTPTAPDRGDVPKPIRDGQGRNYKGIYAFRPAGAGPYRVRVQAGGELFEFTTDLLPRELAPHLDGGFNILLCSCYYQPLDDRGLLGDVVSQIKLRPNLTLMAGDQVYADLPLHTFRRPRSADEIRTDLGNKYRQNWASTALGTPGLGSVLARAPVVCVPDDHEFWNNYPYRQAQIPDTLSGEAFDAWKAASLELFEDYQASDASTDGASRLDVGPLKMLFLDLRSGRDNDGDRLMQPPARAAFDRWIDDLLQGDRSIGVLSSGQALFIGKPNILEKHLADAEMPNYKEFDELSAQIARLADHGVPLVYITGDVHWGRVARGTDLPSRGTPLYEVISSPSCLIDSPTDAFTAWKNRTFNAARPWPRHADAAKVPKQFGPKGRYLIDAVEPSLIGDQVAMVSFARAGAGAEFSVTYYGISRDKALAKSRSFGPFSLRPT
ncbi:alkaline phosphatase D family protein [Variovorax sp. KK3]|uniref:alkaline phosphatase D family protein n=1 Tax=Variovorax sp. KK3 TaxID=1855728 RepID=UPI00097BF360|nr:alkaline phosphatase D family protein [Variovorax sp. KK3]